MVSEFKPPNYTQAGWQDYLSTTVGQSQHTRWQAATGGPVYEAAPWPSPLACEYCGRCSDSLDNCAGCGAPHKVRAKASTYQPRVRPREDDSPSPSITFAPLSSTFSSPAPDFSGSDFSGGGGDFGGAGAAGSWDSGS